jgi:antirestriction protein ArdC
VSTSVYEVITDRIVRLLDEGTVPWRKPWRAADMPRSIRGRAYRGINLWLLLHRGFSDPRWLTFKQAQQLGGRVRPGQKGTPVVLWKPLMVADPNDSARQKKVLLLRYYTVFNVEQCDGLTLPKLKVAEVTGTPVQAADAVIDGYVNTDRGPAFNANGGDRAYYSPVMDSIHIPAPSSFETKAGYYATVFHEMGHSTGHEERLNRKGITGFDHFGSGQYAKEELVAEMTAAFLAGETGLDPAVLDNTAAYIASWKRALTDDPKLVVSAAAQAQKAADLILGREAAAPQEEVA